MAFSFANMRKSARRPGGSALRFFPFSCSWNRDVACQSQLCESEVPRSGTGLEVFDTTLQKTNNWLNEAMRLLDSKDKHQAYLAFRSTLHALRDRLTVEEVAQLAPHLPVVMRGFYYEGWDPTGKPLKLRTREEFLDRIAQELEGVEGMDPETLARAVFAVLEEKLTEGEVEDVKHALPLEIRALWPRQSRI